MNLHLDHLIPLRDAAKLFGISEKRLHELVQAGKIKGAILPGGEIGVNRDAAEINALNENLRYIKRSLFAHLAGVTITVSDGAQKYGVHRNTVLNWVKRGYVKQIKSGYKMEIDEADLAFCARVNEIRKQHEMLFSGPLLNDAGQPYQIKHPSLSEYRRKKKTSK